MDMDGFDCHVMYDIFLPPHTYCPLFTSAANWYDESGFDKYVFIVVEHELYIIVEGTPPMVEMTGYNVLYTNDEYMDGL